MPAATAVSAPAAVLAFDTSTERLAAGLQCAAGPLTVLAAGGPMASAALLPALRALLDQAGLGWSELDAIAFGQGPGAFTGLRTACAVAQGLGLGLGLPLLPIDSLLIVAEDARGQSLVDADADQDLDVVVLMDARMDEIYAGRYRWCRGAWSVPVAPALYTLGGLARLWDTAGDDSDLGLDPDVGIDLDVVRDVDAGSGLVLAGSALLAFADRLALPTGARRCPHEQDRAAALLRLAVMAQAAGSGLDAADALPLYLRDKVAQTTEERSALRAAKLLAQGTLP